MKSADDYAYRAPDPLLVARISESHGFDAAVGRWFWINPTTLAKIAQAGREMRRVSGGPPPRGTRRRTTPEQEAAVIERARALRSASQAAAELGVSYALVCTIHRERGVRLPILPAIERAAKSAATRRARAAAVYP